MIGGAFLMNKYSNQLKMDAVMYYVNNEVSFVEAAKIFNIKSVCSLRKWVYKYRENGTAGLVRNKKASYSGDFKKNVVEYMHANHLSLQQTSSRFNLGDHNVVRKWERIYLEKGPQALFQNNRGRSSMKPKKEIKNKKVKSSKEKELLKKIEYLETENAYLKKLNALIHKKEKSNKKIK